LFFVESNDSLLSMICKITGAGTVAIGIMGPSIAIGRVTAQGCTQIAQNQDHYSLIVRSTFMAAGFIDSSAIYSLIIALLLIVYV
jgi:F-type H+-transporting ATPase subunit c